ncbi:MAG: hypothetical protein CVU23_04995 [Betaproteobacteria bacterium HGW-Betaproteobacteria-17]|nr:MAG: hypothetical protein CVU23_04995 [Betaproteobacteria bacterium HGW-Betaproteobacteria-17]
MGAQRACEVNRGEQQLQIEIDPILVVIACRSAVVRDHADGQRSLAVPGDFRSVSRRMETEHKGQPQAGQVVVTGSMKPVWHGLRAYP